MKLKLPQTKRKIISYFIILCAVLVLAAGCNTGKSDVVATVNGEKISKDDLYNQMVKENGKESLESLITLKVVELEAKKNNIAPTEEDIQKELEKYYEYYGGQENFTQTLATSGYTLDDVKKDVIMSIRIKKLIEPRLSITEEDKKAFFEENKAEFAQEKQVKARHILVETEEKAKEIKEKLTKGEDFSQLAKENSTDTASKDKGGDLGYFGSGQMVKEFEDAAFALNVGETSAPVKSEYGYHIIIVDEKKEAQEANYEQSKDEITDILFDQKAQSEYDPWLQELFKQYEIENFLAKE